MTMADLPVLQTFDRAEDRGVDTCTTCPKLCRWACPVAEAEARETSSPWSLTILSGLLKRGHAAVDEVGALPYHCTHCGACTEACLHHNDVPLWLSLARSRVRAAHAAPPAVGEVASHFAVAGNPYGEPLGPGLERVVAEARGGDGPRPSGAILYHPGCTTLKERPQTVAAFLRTLDLHGIGGVAVGEASAGCCGLPLLWGGDLAGFKAHAERHAQRLASADTVLAHDPACAHAMQVRYPEFGVSLSPQVVHVSAFLAGRIGPGPRREGGSAPRVAYADSCALGRRLGLKDEPRQLVARATGAPPLELPELGGAPLDCCGAGGLLPDTAPDTAEAMGQARLDAFRATGAARLVTFSPRCAAHLARLDPTVDVVDGVELLARVDP